MTSKEIRRIFLDFFKEKSHQIVPSAPLVIKNDPTLMFTNAGMNQFKDFFLGNKPVTYSRIADTQKCLRVSGKHNDLEEVGIDTYHHTFFEMLGNWSFGDYFKKEAIDWAWELLVVRYKLDKDRLYATVFGGDKGDNLPADEEAFEFWKQYLPEERILFADKKDNFWEMGDTGPCGPCSEIHIDLRNDAERAKTPGRELVNQDHPQVVEIWNLVFMQFNRKNDGSLHALPAQHVDTGMGFERLAMALQGKTSNYDTDVFTPLIDFIANAAATNYGKDRKKDIAMRVMADHIRAIAFAIADGEMPSNNKGGYVIKRILRRAVRYAYTFLDFQVPFLYKLVPILAAQFAETFPELKSQEEFITKVIKNEEDTFLRTLENGLKRLEHEMEHLESHEIPGKVVFELYDTFGFPADLTALIARENHFTIDEKGFEQAMGIQKERSRKDAISETDDWQFVQEDKSINVDFLGYDTLQASAKIVEYRKIARKKQSFYQIVLDQTPFYAESGGQVGDTGYIQAHSNGEKIEVIDTQKENDLIIHITKKLPTDIYSSFDCVVDAKRRKNIKGNHSATHLLHAALRHVLGTHVTQKGSLVAPNALRFDFSHFAKMSEEEILAVEGEVNQKIRENIELQEMRNVPIEQAKQMGAMALFGEKYGDFVRVIIFDKEHSVELCGGTHVASTGEIGYFKIVSEASVASGVRRIEALTAQAAEDYVQNELAQIQEIKNLLKGSKQITKDISRILDEKSELQKKIELYENQVAQTIKKQLLETCEKLENGINFIAQKVELPTANHIRQIAFELEHQVDNLFLVIATPIEGKPQIAVMLSANLVSDKGLNASKIVRELAKEIKGGGGGQPFFATAGGKDVSGLDNVIEKAKTML
ncbi:MAG: alanine--tRNA ligase [Bernardetiaceae bacterium]|nr:alanine--tRNA ligase [Bernardetiaceae bacterium]